MEVNNNAFAALLNEHEAAKLLRMSVAWLRKRRLENKEPRAIRLGTSIRYHPETILGFVKSLTPPVDEGGSK